MKKASNAARKAAPKKKRPASKKQAAPTVAPRDDVERALKSGRYLVLIGTVEDGQLLTRHHTANFPFGDFDTLAAVERKKFFSALG